MKLYIFYMLASLFTAWVVIFYYGVSAGFANYVPIAALLGCVLLFAIAAPILMYNPRIGLIIGVIGCLLILPFSVVFLRGIFEDGVFNLGVLLALPSLMTFISTYFTVRALLNKSVLSDIPGNASIKILLAGIPIVLFILYLLFYGKYWSSNMFKP